MKAPRVVLGVIFALALSIALHADVLVVQRSVTLKADPVRDAEVVAQLIEGARLELLEDAQQSGYYHARDVASGEEGWVYRTFVRRERTAGAGGSDEESRPPSARNRGSSTRASGACADSLADCPANGCAVEGTEHALANSLKRNFPQGPVKRLTFEDFAALQTIVNDLGIPMGRGSHLSQTARDRLKGLALANASVGETDHVELIGFIEQSRNLKASGGESVNCKLSGAGNNDVHLPIVRKVEDDEYASIVVEPIPQNRPDAWTVAEFKRIQSAGHKVLIRGQLFFDNQHRVRDDPEEEEGLGSEPKRFSLWEIHPITAIFECTRADQACSPTDLSQWRELR